MYSESTPNPTQSTGNEEVLLQLIRQLMNELHPCQSSSQHPGHGPGNRGHTSRIKDIVICDGRNVYPHELEEAVGNIQGARKGRISVIISRPVRPTGSDGMLPSNCVTRYGPRYCTTAVNPTWPRFTHRFHRWR
ncbi:MAG: hypothetical protein K9K37_10250 [Desulfocapsa sp.]|nr:hypothetical protein [Desulfocapsa sp.]